MQVVDSILTELKKLEGCNDTASLVAKGELEMELQLYIESKRRGHPIFEGGMLVGVQEFNPID